MEQAGHDVGDARDALARLAQELANPPLHDWLQPFPVRIDADGSVVVGLKYRAELGGRREMEFFHGGVIATLIDIAAHAAVASCTRRMAPTVDLRIDYLRPAPPEEIHATARVLKLGRNVSRADVEVRTTNGTLVAVGRGAFSTLDDASASTVKNER